MNSEKLLHALSHQRAKLGKGERLEGKVDAVADDARKLADLRVDVARGDHDGLVSAQRGGVNV